MGSDRMFTEEKKTAAFVLQADETVLWAEKPAAVALPLQPQPFHIYTPEDNQ